MSGPSGRGGEKTPRSAGMKIDQGSDDVADIVSKGQCPKSNKTQGVG